MKKGLFILLIFCCSLIIISCRDLEESTTDTTAPVIAEVTAVTTPTNDTTPDYTFSSSEAGTITYGGSCSSRTRSAFSGNNTITLVSLSEGTYSDCTIKVTDTSGNVSVALNISSFTVFIYKFVAVGNSGTILTSTDGTTWTSRTSGTTQHLTDVTYGNSTYVAVGNSGTILTSTDGTTWTTAASGLTNNGSTVRLSGVTYGNNTFVTVGDGNYGNGAVFTSTNGSDWSFQNSGSDATFFDVTYANNFIASGHGGAIIYSSDATTWTSSDNVTSNELYGVAYGGGIYLGVGDNYTLIYSFDGTSWGNMGSYGDISINDIIYANSNFYAIMGSGYISICPNCISSSVNWNDAINTGVSDDLNGIVYGNSSYVIVGASGTILTSTNGTTWTSRTSGTSNDLKGVIYSQ